MMIETERLRRLAYVILCLVMAMHLCSCGATESASSAEDNNSVGVTEEMKLYINGTEIPVKWESNSAVTEMTEWAAEAPRTVSMSMYGGWEQVGALGRAFTTSDKQITAKNGDIVLYSGDQIVVFYGSNSWSYTKLGHMDLSSSEVRNLLSKNDVTITLRAE